jgi:beta-N-acetylhexosaminidase
MSLGPLMVDVAGRSLLPEDRDLLEHPLVGGVILFTRNYESPEQLAALIADIRRVRTPPLLVAADQEGGRVQRFRPGFTLLPSMRLIGREYDADPVRGRAVAREIGWLLASELRSVGVDLAFAPVVDLDYGVSEVIGDRSFHRRAVAVGDLAVSLMAGMREAGMAATAKHFPGHGAVAPDSHVALPVDRREYADLDADLAPYRRMFANDLSSVMLAHIVFEQVDGLPASLSRRWVTDVLRGEFDFRGAVFTDDLSMAGAAAFGGIVERARLALDAGCDMLPVCNHRASVDALIRELDRAPSPVSALRLARLRGRAGAPAREPLAKDPRFLAAVELSIRLREGRPDLTLKGR